MNLRTWVLLIGLVAGIQNVNATPHTRIDPYASLEGALAAERFGEQVRCSAPIPGSSNRSVVAVAAPSANAGTGAVYLYDPVDTEASFQTLVPAGEELASQFGSAVEFIDDINGDGIDDIVVGAPGTSAQVDGKLYAFVSSYQQETLRFIQCGVLGGTRGFAERLHAIRVAGGESDVSFVVGVPSESRIAGYNVSVQSDGACLFSQGNSFAAVGEAAGRFGDGLGQVKRLVSLSPGIATLAVVAPHQGSSGLVSLLEADSTEMMVPSSNGEVMPVASTLSGSSIGTQYSSDVFAIGNPAALSNVGLVSIYSASSFSEGALCSRAGELSDPSGVFGRVVAHLGGSFAGLVGEASAAFAVTKSEPATGGSLSIFGVAQDGSCGDPIELNNCRLDPYQEQGSALAGGDQCQTEHAGVVRRFLVVGSPGWSGGRGRIDLYLEGAEHEAAVECQQTSANSLTLETTSPAQPRVEMSSDPVGSEPPTPSPEEIAPSPTSPASTPTSTAVPSVTATLPSGTTAVPEISVTVAPTQTGHSSATPTPVVYPTESTPSDPPTAVPTSPYTPTPGSPQTPVSSATATPVLQPTDGFGSDQTPTQTPTPTPTEEGSEDETEVYEPTPQYSPTATSTSTSLQDDGFGSVQDEPSIPVFPGAAGLPTPEVTQNGNQVEIAMPVVRPELSASAQTKAVKTLMKRGRLSKKRAQLILADPKNLVVTYIVTYSEVTQRSRFALIQSAHADDGRRKRSSKVRRVRSRSNRVALARLQPGVTYRVSYQVEIAVRKPRAVLGVTKASSVTQFVYRAS